MGQTENGLRITMRIGGMDIAFDDIIVHQPIDDIGAFPICCADHQGMPEKVALIDESVGADALALPEIFERTAGHRLRCAVDLGFDGKDWVVPSHPWL